MGNRRASRALRSAAAGIVLFASGLTPAQTVVVSGERKAWHTVTLTIDGPATAEGATPNPFRDYRLDVVFTRGAATHRVPGFFAADGDAATTHATGGCRWRAHFVPDAAGTWSWAVSFRTGPDVAADLSAGAGTPVAGVDGTTGSFMVAPSDATPPDLRARGLLEYDGERYLRFAATGERFLKGGADSPENLLAYFGFDGTRNDRHHYAPHACDWSFGDPDWVDDEGDAGRNLIGALGYLAGKGMNSVYFLTMNVGGDGDDVWPWTARTAHDRYDCSKLDQWDIVFRYMTRVGLALHVVTQETENDQLLDGGALGIERKIYYRELIARFGHALALQWNLGEESSNTDQQRRDFATFIRALDPYDHPIVCHTFPSQQSLVYDPLLGFPHFEGPSLQMGVASLSHLATNHWVEMSRLAGRPWVVCVDEIGPAGSGVLPDAADPDHDVPRRDVLWGNLMGGGAGVEWYFGYSYPHDDLDCEDWRSRDRMWDLTRHALDFFRLHLPFHDMQPSDALVSAPGAWALARPGDVYAVYLPGGGTTMLDLGPSTERFDVRWYDPRAGGALLTSAVTRVSGPGLVSLGSPPAPPASDWAVLVRRVGPRVRPRGFAGRP